MMNKKFLFCAFLTLIMVFPCLAWAGELRVVDSLGLTRAVKTVRDRARVQIQVRRDEQAPPTDVMPLLTNQNGIASDITAQPGESGKFVFDGVSEGVWRLRLRDDARTLIDVRILD